MSLGGVVRAALWCLSASLMCSGSREMDGIAQKYQEAKLGDIQRDVERAVQLLNKKNFLPWQREQINQMVPRLHLGMIELWLEFRRLQEDKESMWQKMTGMLTRSAAACQEVASDVLHMKFDVFSRLALIEGEIVRIISRVEKLEENKQRVPEASVSSSQHGMVGTEIHSQTGDIRPKAEASEGIHNDTASTRTVTGLAPPENPSDKAICPARILNRVSNLTQVLNDHTALLVELYERVTTLEDTGRPLIGNRPWIPVPEGSGEGD